MCSVDRNHILVKTYLVGGASERIIPGRTLTEVITSAPLLCQDNVYLLDKVLGPSRGGFVRSIVYSLIT